MILSTAMPSDGHANVHVHVCDHCRMVVGCALCAWEWPSEESLCCSQASTEQSLAREKPYLLVVLASRQASRHSQQNDPVYPGPERGTRVLPIQPGRLTEASLIGPDQAGSLHHSQYGALPCPCMNVAAPIQILE